MSKRKSSQTAPQTQEQLVAEAEEGVLHDIEEETPEAPATDPDAPDGPVAVAAAPAAPKVPESFEEEIASLGEDGITHRDFLAFARANKPAPEQRATAAARLLEEVRALGARGLHFIAGAYEQLAREMVPPVVQAAKHAIPAAVPQLEAAARVVQVQAAPSDLWPAQRPHMAMEAIATNPSAVAAEAALMMGEFPARRPNMPVVPQRFHSPPTPAAAVPPLVVQRGAPIVAGDETPYFRVVKRAMIRLRDGAYEMAEGSIVSPLSHDLEALRAQGVELVSAQRPAPPTGFAAESEPLRGPAGQSFSVVTSEGADPLKVSADPEAPDGSIITDGGAP